MISDPEAEAMFDDFLKAESCREIIETFTKFHEHVFGDLEQAQSYLHPYHAFKQCVRSTKARELWAKLDARASHIDYEGGEACKNTKILVIGAGPCGLRFAIEAALLGGTVVVLEKRSVFSRNNVLHLWPYLITDLKNIGAKIFDPKFCVGGIDHISIRRLQLILMKTALLLGVQIYTDTSFEGLVEPSGQLEAGWKASVIPEDSPVSQYQFDVLIGADGKRNTLAGFRRKEFRGRLAIAITFNFVNHRTTAEALVPEVGGLASYARIATFKEMKNITGIDLENFVYYKNETHYFVMTARKASLLSRGVLKNNYTESEELLNADNVDEEKLLEYAKEAASYMTSLQTMEYERNQNGKPDIAMFDFTSMFTASSASCVRERMGKSLLMGLVGDSLLEPFWPTGTGCARGFLSAFDAAWMIKRYKSREITTLDVIAERESLFQILPQSSMFSLHKNFNTYSIDPSSR
ncbi:F-actin-monooxygenase mical1-like [Liolophura sinensis]|uniref:F-actin-monooxygenase mical1-like n=1 Tax=Liolophura sinensis TaxID=3198878 RepID=UPI00315984F2